MFEKEIILKEQLAACLPDGFSRWGEISCFPLLSERILGGLSRLSPVFRFLSRFPIEWLYPMHHKVYVQVLGAKRLLTFSNVECVGPCIQSHY
jgi:hypothetical protein